MMYILMAVFAAVIVVLDQLSKLWIVSNIELFGKIPAINGLFHLTYVQNTGAAFSSFEGMRWLFILICLGFYKEIHALLHL